MGFIHKIEEKDGKIVAHFKGDSTTALKQLLAGTAEGNFGVGTDTPTTQVSAATFLEISADQGSAALGLNYSSGSSRWEIESNSGDDLVFSRNGTERFRLDGGSGLGVFNDGITLPTSGGTPSTLDYYEEYIHNTTFSWDGGGSPGTSVSVGCKIVRCGNLVTMLIPSNAHAITGTGSTTFSADTVLPSRFRPTTSPVGHYMMISNGSFTGTDTLLSIDSAGNILGRRKGSAAFPNDAQSTSGFNDGLNNGHLVYWMID